MAPGSTRFTVTLAALPASERPSDGDTTALFATKLPITCGPGTLCNAALTSTSILGIVYDPRNLSCVRNGDCWWQYCRGNWALLASPSTGRLVRSSGSCCATSQLSIVVRPVLIPPCIVSPLRGRAVKIRSNPFQCSYWLP